MNSDLVSIIIPVYNSGESIAKCIDSILAQNYNNWELLLINDGSTDNSDIICREYSNKDKRIRYFEKENKGGSNTRNLGIKEAKGKWIIFVDSDDLVSPNYISHLIKTSDGDSYTHVIQGFKCIDENDKFRKWMDIDYNDEKCDINKIEPFLKKYDLIDRVQIWGKLFSTDLIKTNKLYFNEKISLGEDAIFSHQYLLLSKRIILSKNSDYYYRNPYLVDKNNLTKKPKSLEELYYLTLTYKELCLQLITKLNIQDQTKKNKVMSFYITPLRLLLQEKELFTTYPTCRNKILGDLSIYKPTNIKDKIFKYFCKSKQIKFINYLYNYKKIYLFSY